MRASSAFSGSPYVHRASKGPAQGVLGGDRVGVLGAEVGQPQLDGPARVLLRLLILAELLVGLPQGVADRGLDQGPVGEPLGDVLVGLGQDLVHRRDLALGPGGAGRADQVVDQEVDDLAGLGGAAVGLLAARSARFRSCVTSTGRLSASPSAFVARIASQVLTAVPATSAVATTAAVASATRFRRPNFRSRYQADGGPASTGSWLRWRRRSAASAVGRLVPPRPVLLQRTSSRSSPARRAPASPAWPARCAAAPRSTAASPRTSLSRVLGLGGSSSRIVRRISVERRRASAARGSSGVVPVSSSYSSTPSA